MKLLRNYSITIENKDQRIGSINQSELEVVKQEMQV